MAQRQAIPSDDTSVAPVAERKRIPMSVPVSKLSVPEIPGYHLHWFNGDPARISRAQQGGYEFVDESEVHLNNRVLGDNGLASGNTDMGTRVSIVAGADLGSDGQAQRLYLMKIKQEWWEEDQKALEADGSRLEGVRKSLIAGTLGAEKQSADDRGQIYVDQKRTKIPAFFQRKT